MHIKRHVPNVLNKTMPALPDIVVEYDDEEEAE
jgi:hypothetical protein